MKLWKAGLMCLAAFLVQASLLNLISIKGYTPNLLLCAVIILSFLYEDDMNGLIFGAFFGVLADVCFGTVVGPTPLALVCVALFIIFVRVYANTENIINMWLVSIASMGVYAGVYWILQKIAGNPIGIMYVLKDLPMIGLYTLAVTTLLYLILIRTVIRHRKDRYFR